AAGMGIGIRSMCLIETAIDDGRLTLTAPKMPTISTPLKEIPGRESNVTIWRSQCVAIDQGDTIAAWLTEYLSRERRGIYRLVRMPDDGVRKTSHGDGEIAFP